MYIKYRQIDFAIRTNTIGLSHIWNTAAFIVGILACIGMSLVANFQETTIVIIHGLGAVLAFAIGSAYFLIEVRQ